MKQENWDKVLEHTHLALQINPEDDRALFTRYRAYDATDKFSEALDCMISICCLKMRDPMYMKVMDSAIMKVSDSEGEEYIKKRVPSPRSTFNVDAYLKTFASDLVGKWWRGEGELDVEIVRQLLSEQSLEEASRDGDGDTETKLS